MNRFALVLMLSFMSPQLAFSADSQVPKVSAFFTVVEAIDCDLLKLSDGSTVRLIGVDCPESKDQERNKKKAEVLGIDPAQYSSYEQKARAFVNKLVTGQEVRLEYDEANTATNHRDEQGNVLAYVVIRQGMDAPYIYDEKEIPLGDFFGTGPGILVFWGRGDEAKEKFGYLLNGMIIRSGHGFVSRRFDFQHKTSFLEIEQDAKNAKRGLWG